MTEQQCKQDRNARAKERRREAAFDARQAPTPGYWKLGSPARAAARSRASAFYPFN